MAAGEGEVEVWARAAQRGDELALARLLRAVRPLVYRWALVQTGSPDDAEDITQRTLMRVSSHIGEFAFAARFTTWLYAITRSTAADARRTHTRRAALLNAQSPPADSVSQEHAETSRLVRLVREQLGGLPARQRELFDLVDLQGYTPGEAAELLNMNPNTARVHVLRARRTLRARILAQHPGIVEELR